MTLDFLDAVLKKLQLKKWAGTVDIGWNNEPMLDWDSLRMGVRKIREAFPSAFVRMYSNGFGLTQEKLNELMALGLSYFFITLHENDEKRRQLILSWVPAKDQTRIRVTLFQEIAILNASGHAVEGAPPSNEKFCVMQFAPVIRLNGDITLCCCDYYSETVLGNILRDDFWQVWRKSWWQRVRIMFGSKAAKACHACYNMTRTPLRKPAPKQPAATASAA